MYSPQKIERKKEGKNRNLSETGSHGQKQSYISESFVKHKQETVTMEAELLLVPLSVQQCNLTSVKTALYCAFRRHCFSYQSLQVVDRPSPHTPPRR